MTRILQGMAIMIAHPWIPAVVGVLLLGLGRWRRSWALTWVGGAWLLYASYETGMRLRWLCSGECNIRIDLLLIYPLLLVATAAAAAGVGLRRKG